LATSKKRDVGAAEALLTTTAQMIGSALGKIAVKTGIESPPKTAAKRKKIAATKKVSATRPKASRKKALSPPANHSKSAPKIKKRS